MHLFVHVHLDVFLIQGRLLQPVPLTMVIVRMVMMMVVVIMLFAFMMATTFCSLLQFKQVFTWIIVSQQFFMVVMLVLSMLLMMVIHEFLHIFEIQSAFALWRQRRYLDKQLDFMLQMLSTTLA